MDTLQQPLKLNLYEYSQIQLKQEKSNELRKWIYSLAELLVRLYIANIFFTSGWSKIQNWSSTLFLFADQYQVPFLDPGWATVMITAGEMGFSLLLVLGFWSRMSALGLFVINALALYSYYGVLKETSLALHDHLHWGLLLLLLMTSKCGYMHCDRLKELAYKTYNHFGSDQGIN